MGRKLCICQVVFKGVSLQKKNIGLKYSSSDWEDLEITYLMKRLEMLESGQEAVSGGIIALIIAAISAVIGLCFKLFGGSSGGGGSSAGSSKVTKTFDDIKKLAEKAEKIEIKMETIQASGEVIPVSMSDVADRATVNPGTPKITVKEVVQVNKVPMTITVIKPNEIPKLTEVLQEIVAFEVNFSKTIWELFNKDLNADTLDESFSENVLNDEKAQELADKFKDTTNLMFKEYEGKKYLSKLLTNSNQVASPKTLFNVINAQMFTGNWDLTSDLLKEYTLSIRTMQKNLEQDQMNHFNFLVRTKDLLNYLQGQKKKFESIKGKGNTKTPLAKIYVNALKNLIKVFSTLNAYGAIIDKLLPKQLMNNIKI